MLISMKDMLLEAKRKKYAVAAPNVFNEESVRSAFEAANELKSPIIINVGYAVGLKEMATISKLYSQRYPDVVYALNLDHGSSFEEAVYAIQCGFSSVMIDCSTLELEKNIEKVKEVVRLAHSVGVSVEAELGHVGQGITYEETRDAGLTNVDEALYFVNETGIDCLAVAIGTSHGAYKGKPYLDFERLEDLNKRLHIPLVLHGGSSTGDENLKKAIGIGIQKINLHTDLADAWKDKLKAELALEETTSESLTSDEFFNSKKKLWQILRDSSSGYKEKLMHYMIVFGSNDRT